MHFYCIGYEELRKLPVRTFWELSKNINRIRASEDRRLVVVFGSSVMNDPTALLEALSNEQGKICHVEESGEFDRDGLHRLASIMGIK